MKNFRERFVDFIISKPWQTLVIFTVFWFASLSQLPSFHANFTPRHWFFEDSEIIQDLNEFEKRFQSDESIVIGVYHPENVLNAETLKLVRKLHDEMWQVPHVSRVQSLYNSPHIRGENDEIRMDPIIPDEFGHSDQEISKLRKFFKNYKDVDGYLLSENKKFTLIHANIGVVHDEILDAREINGILKERIKNIDTGDSKLYIYGTIIMQDELRAVTNKDTLSLVPLVLVIIISIVVFLYRSAFAVFSVFIVMLTTVSFTIGILCIIGWAWSGLLGAIPGILMAICIADTIHIVESLYKNVEASTPFKEALRKSMLSNFSSTFLTSFTTFVGFSSLTVAEIAPIYHLGVLVGIGALAAWLFTYVLIGSFYSLWGEKIVKPRPFRKNRKKISTENYIKWIAKKKMPIYAFFLACFFGFLYLSSQNKVDSDPLGYFTEQVPYKKQLNFIFKSLNVKNNLSLEIDSGKVDGIKSAGFFKKIEQLDTFLKSRKEVLYTDSTLDDLKKLYKAANNDDPSYYRIPDDDKMISQLLFFFSLGLPEGVDLNLKTSSDYRYLRIINLVTISRTAEAETFADEVLQKAKELGLNAKVNGGYRIYLTLNPMVVETFFKSILSALVIIFFIVLFTYRNLTVALISFIPNVYSLITTGFLIKTCGMYLDIGTAIVSAICLGISIDDTIHFIAHYSQNYEKTKDVPESLIKCLNHVGSALVITTVILTLSFLSYLFAGFLPNRNFGILTAATLIFALFADVVLLPAILLYRSKGESSS